VRDVSIIGVGQTKVGEHWGTSLRHLAYDVIRPALDDAGIGRVDALYVGNMLAGELAHQEHLGALIADFAGLRGVEAVRVEAAEASGAAALRVGCLAVASGLVNTALVVGVEKMSDVVGKAGLTARMTAADAEYEGAHGATPAALAALAMRRYMHEHQLALENFAGFSVNAHANGSLNPNAMFRNRLKPESFVGAPIVAAPVNLFDSAPDADGAAAVVLASAEHAADMVPQPVRVVASAVATDALALHDREDPLALKAASLSSERAYQQAGIGPDDIDLFELHDGFTILAALSLEACGFTARGEGWKLANEAGIGLSGRVPISTFGGLKSRGFPGGATGVYQAVEVTLQLRGQAGDNQVANAQRGMAQSLGGFGATAITHIFEKCAT
jgi:acetyl-CoA C-acetyltransferase